MTEGPMSEARPEAAPQAPDALVDAAEVTPGGVLTRRAAATAFEVHLDVFSGPFDLLLGLIAKHRLDITEIALARVTDEFIGHLRSARESAQEWDLSQASEFVLVAATLLDLKAARLLPHSGPEDEDDLALIEARDLLFARLLQYRAFKDIARTFGERMSVAGRMRPRAVGLESRFASLLPELVISVTPQQLAAIAARALTPRAPDIVGTDHLHAPAVSVREQAGLLGERLRRAGVASFRALVEDAASTLVIVARFLALLELFRDKSVAFDQAEALGELTVRWTGAMEGAVEVDDEFDDESSTQEDTLQEHAPHTDPGQERATQGNAGQEGTTDEPAGDNPTTTHEQDER